MQLKRLQGGKLDGVEALFLDSFAEYDQAMIDRLRADNPRLYVLLKRDERDALGVTVEVYDYLSRPPDSLA